MQINYVHSPEVTTELNRVVYNKLITKLSTRAPQVV